MRLTDLIRGAKAVSEDANRAEEKDKAPPTPPGEAQVPASSQEPSSQHRATPPAPPVIPSSSSLPPPPAVLEKPPLSFSHHDEQPAIPPLPPLPPSGPVAPLTPPSASVVPPSVVPVLPKLLEAPPIQLKSVQGAQKETRTVQNTDPPPIQLRSLGRLARRPVVPESSFVITPPTKLPTAFESVSEPSQGGWRKRPVPQVPPMVPSPEPTSPVPDPIVAKRPIAARPQTEGSGQEPQQEPQMESVPENAHGGRDLHGRAAAVQSRSPEGATYQDDRDWYGLAEQELSRLGSAIKSRQAISIEAITDIATGMVDALEHSDRLLVAAFSGQKGSFLIANMVNVGILSIKLGRGLGYVREDLIRLGTAGLLHDVGMFLVPELLIHKPENLGAQDLAVLRQHPELGGHILNRLGAQFEWLAQVAWQEHERSSGRGYPKALREGQIHEYARIVGLADVFEALLSPRPYRPRLLPHIAMRELLASEKQSFPHQLMKVLVEQFSVFPLGTTVRLNTGEVGVVTQLNPRHPLRPVVRVTHLADRTAPPECKFVDLSKTTLIHVAVVESDSGA